MTIAQRFWPKVRKSDGCWLWTGCRDAKGYGRFGLERVGRRNITDRAHRVAYRLEHGAIPEGFCVCHRCDNPACVRPDHLFLGTQADNVRDCQTKGRFSHRGNPRKLTAESAAEIRRAFAAGVTVRELAERFGIARSHANGIVAGTTWRVA